MLPFTIDNFRLTCLHDLGRIECPQQNWQSNGWNSIKIKNKTDEKIYNSSEA